MVGKCMSKKSKRTKQASPAKQLPQRASIPSQIHEPFVNRAQYARQQMHMGDFAGCIRTCESLLSSLPRRSERRLEILALLGLAHGMLKHYQQSYDVFIEAIVLDLTVAEFWHNSCLACHYMVRSGEVLCNFECVVEFSKHDTSEMTRKFVAELEVGRQEL